MATLVESEKLYHGIKLDRNAEILFVAYFVVCRKYPAIFNAVTRSPSNKSIGLFRMMSESFTQSVMM